MKKIIELLEIFKLLQGGIYGMDFIWLVYLMFDVMKRLFFYKIIFLFFIKQGYTQDFFKRMQDDIGIWN